MIKHDLILTIVNRGFADEVMSAAKAAGAFGGTVVNARGTGTHELQHFFGAIIQPEKELVMILTEREKRNSIMEAICRDAGLSEGMPAFPSAAAFPCLLTVLRAFVPYQTLMTGRRRKSRIPPKRCR